MCLKSDSCGGCTCFSNPPCPHCTDGHEEPDSDIPDVRTLIKPHDVTQIDDIWLLRYRIVDSDNKAHGITFRLPKIPFHSSLSVLRNGPDHLSERQLINLENFYAEYAEYIPYVEHKPTTPQEPAHVNHQDPDGPHVHSFHSQRAAITRAVEQSLSRDIHRGNLLASAISRLSRTSRVHADILFGQNPDLNLE